MDELDHKVHGSRVFPLIHSMPSLDLSQAGSSDPGSGASVHSPSVAGGAGGSGHGGRFKSILSCIGGPCAARRMGKGVVEDSLSCRVRGRLWVAPVFDWLGMGPLPSSWHLILPAVKPSMFSQSGVHGRLIPSGWSSCTSAGRSPPGRAALGG